MADSLLTQFVRVEKCRLSHRLHYAGQATWPVILLDDPHFSSTATLRRSSVACGEINNGGYVLIFLFGP